MAKTITVSEKTYESIKDKLEVEEKVNLSCFEDMVGKSFYFRTVTFHQVGKVEKIFGNMVQLSNASWVADSGRFTQAIKEGLLEEVEPVGECYVNLNTCVDIFPWRHELPMDQK